MARRAWFSRLWRGGREAEGGGLLNRYTLSRRIVGSNPIPSAIIFRLLPSMPSTSGTSENLGYTYLDTLSTRIVVDDDG